MPINKKHTTKIKESHEEMKATMDANQENMEKSQENVKEWMEAAITSIRYEFQETINNPMEDFLAFTDHRNHTFCEVTSVVP
jgi:uncharacterized FlaG/YvyC family protein